MKTKNFKRIISLGLMLMLVFALGVSAFAVNVGLRIAQDIPTYQTVEAGKDLTLSFGVVVNDGGSVAFQWHSANGPISGANGPILTAQYYQNVSVYCVAVSSTGQAVTSSTCQITVTNSGNTGAILPDATLPPVTPVPTVPVTTPAPSQQKRPAPVITRQPVGANLANGQTATLSVEAALQNWSTSAQLRYQWYVSSSNNAAYASPIANAYSPTYTTSPTTATMYYLVAVWATDGVNTSTVTYSNLVPVSYGSTELKITKHPTGETVKEGASALFIARADNAVKREWRIVSKDTTKTVPVSQAAHYFSGLMVSGDQTDSLALSNIPAAMNDWSVECKFTGADGRTLYTKGAIIKVISATPTPTPSSYIPGSSTATPTPTATSYIPGANAVTAPTISTQPVGAVLAEGESVTLSVGAAGADASKGVNLSYQWYRSEQNSNANGTPISGATGQTYIPDTISGSRYYYVAVTASNGKESKTTYSSPATVTYTAPISTPSPSPTATAAPAIKDNVRNPGLASMLIAPIIAIVAAAIAIGVGLFFLIKNSGKNKDDDYRYDDRYDDEDYYDNRRERRDSRRDSRRIDKEYYSDDEFDRRK